MIKQPIYLFYKLMWLIFSVQFLVGCSRYPIEYPTLPIEQLILPVEKYRVAQELQSGKLLLEDFGAKENPQFIVWDLVTNEWQYLLLPTGLGCKPSRYYRTQVLSNGQLALMKLCPQVNPEAPYPSQRHEATLVAYDIETEELTSLSSEALWGYDMVSSFDWNAKLNKGVVSIGSLTESMYWVTPDKQEPMDFLIEYQGEKWSPAKTLEIIKGRERGLYEDDNSTGNASPAAWSPDGEKIVFWVMPDVIGLDGMARFSQPKYLFEMNPTDMVPHPILEEEVIYGGLIKWHPQNEWVLFRGEIASELGIWMFNVQNKRLVSVAIVENTQAYLWADGGDAVIFNQCLTPDCESFKTFKYDVKDVLVSVTD